MTEGPLKSKIDQNAHWNLYLQDQNDNKNVIKPLYLLDLKPIDFKINRFKKPWFEIHWFLNSLFGSFYTMKDLKFHCLDT